MDRTWKKNETSYAYGLKSSRSKIISLDSNDETVAMVEILKTSKNKDLEEGIRASMLLAA